MEALRKRKKNLKLRGSVSPWFKTGGRDSIIVDLQNNNVPQVYGMTLFTPSNLRDDALSGR
jgi:hypothetical protein